MPTSIIAAAAAYGASAAVGGGLLGAFVGAVVSFSINAAFAPKQKQQQQGLDGAGNIADRTQTLTSIEPAAPWEIVYGEVEKGGRVIFRHATDDIDRTLTSESHVIPATPPYLVPLDGMPDFDGNGSVRATIWHTEGENFYDLVDFAVAGGAPGPAEYSFSSSGYEFNAADAGKPVEIQYYKRVTGRAHARLHLVIALAAHQCESIDVIKFSGEEVPLDGAGNATGKYAGFVYISKHLGASDQAADATLMAEASDKWTANHRLRGHAYIYVRLLKNADLFPNGVPNITARVRGRLVYDPRSSLTAYSPNWALCQMDYLNNPIWGVAASYGTEIDNTFLSAAANVSDEAIALAAGGTEPRYEMHGVVDTSQTPQDVIEKLLTAGAGRLVYVGGRWKLRAGAYITPTVTLDESDARGPVRTQTRLSRRDTFNAVKGVYLSPENFWQPADFPPVTNATYQSEDGGERVWFDMELPFTKSPATAQRIAKIALERVRQQITVDYPAKLAAYKVEPPETLMLNNARFGYSAKVFELMDSELVVEQDDQDRPVIGVNLSLRETASGVYDWNSGNETSVDLAPNTTLPDARDVGPPGVPVAIEEIYSTSDSSGVHAKVTITWAAAPDSRARFYDHQYKLKAASAWTPHGGRVDGTRDEIADLEPGIYQSRVRAVSALGVRSAWSQVEYEVHGLTAPPSNVTGFAVQSYADQAKFVWDLAPELDVRIGGKVVVRHSPFTIGGTWNKGVLINADGFPGAATSGFGPLSTGTYMAKFRDSTGHYSPAEAAFVITEALLRAITSIAFVDFHPSFTGSYTNTVATGAVLQLTAMTLWDDMPGLMDDWGLIDYLGGIVPAGSALFDSKLDLGSSRSARLITTLKSEAYSIDDLWDSRGGLMDDWGTIDSDTIEDANVELMVSTTADDPNGSPTWGPWHRLGLVADYNTRGFRFRADFTSGDSTHNRRISELTVTAKEAV
jgi:hypothetical protein